MTCLDFRQCALWQFKHSSWKLAVLTVLNWHFPSIKEPFSIATYRTSIGDLWLFVVPGPSRMPSGCIQTCRTDGCAWWPIAGDYGNLQCHWESLGNRTPIKKGIITRIIGSRTLFFPHTEKLCIFHESQLPKTQSCSIPYDNEYIYIYILYIYTYIAIPLGGELPTDGKWVTTLVVNGISGVSPLITGVN